MMRRTRPLLAFTLKVLLATLVFPVLAAAQATVTLTGRVTDPQAGAVQGAAVTVRNTSTSATSTTASDDNGRFTVPMLPPGVYDVDVALDRFAPWRANGVELEIGQDRSIDVHLSLGRIQEAIVVRDVARPVTTSVGDVLSAARIASLPLNGRNFLELSLLVPGNSPTPTFDPTKTNTVMISSAGQLGRGGHVTIDGQDNNDDVVGGPLMNLPIDAVQEFQIATNNFGAELGRSAASAINVVTRSGGNVNHGSASIFARDGRWQATPTTFDPTTTGTPPFDREQVSASVGGPLRRDRVFWFGAAEYRNQDGAVMVGTRDTATRTIRRNFAAAPLDDALWTARLDAGVGANRVTVRYAGERGADTSASAIERALGSATQRQQAINRYHSVMGSWTAARSATFINAVHASRSTFFNDTTSVASGPQYTFPSLQDGASFRMPQQTHQRRLQFSDDASLVRGAHTVRFGANAEHVAAEFDLGVFQQGRIELVEDFPTFDHNGDGKVDDNDLLFAVTLRSGKPDQTLVIPDANNWHLAGFVQDNWSVARRLQINLGLRYELDTDVNNQSRVDQLNPIVLPFVKGDRHRDTNNFAPRAAFVWNVDNAGLIVRGGYGIYYDRVMLEIESLERGLDGRALPIEVRAGNLLFLDPTTGRFPAFAPTISKPFTGFILPGAGASGINIIDSHLRSPMVQAVNLGFEGRWFGATTRLDAVHDAGRDFVIGRTVGEVFNPVVGGPDRVVNLESSARTQYDALMLSTDRRFARGDVRAAYTLSKALNYANDDQIPFLNGPIDPNDLRREFGPTPNDRRHRFVASGSIVVAGGVSAAAVWTVSSAVPMDIMMPDGQTRVPVLQRNAGGRQFHDAASLNAFIAALNAGGGIGGVPLPFVSDNARFGDSFNSIDLRVSRPVAASARVRIEPMLEIFNLFNTTNILGTTNVNYSGFANVLVRDSQDPGAPGYLRSSSFGTPLSTAGGIFGSGGPRAAQIAVRVTF